MPQSNSLPSVFRLRHRTDQSQMISVGVPLFDRLLGLERCQALYDKLESHPDGNFLPRVLQALNVTGSLRPGDRDKIPGQGPLVVVANHPFGAIEGILLAHLIRQVRPDVKILGNYLLNRIPQMRDFIIPVDPFDQNLSSRRNITPVRQAIRWVRDGGVLIVFPAGEVSRLNIRRREVTDPAWDSRVAPLLRHCRAPVLPVYFPGGNSPLFQFFGLLHPRLRTALLPHELLNKQHRTLEVRVGSVVPFKKVAEFDNSSDLMEFLRLQTYLLGQGPVSTPKEKIPARTAQAPIIPPLDEDLLALDIRLIPSRQKVASQGELEVYLVEATQIPSILREIGRLREMAFRQAGEGTGRSLDIDPFDFHYQHLFLWHPQRREVVGAYRLGRTDIILEQQGISGLYSHTLFALNRQLFDHLGPALELGRSFIRPEYQKSYTPLLLLWKGIGHFIRTHPQYRYLFGPVSISQDYLPLARSLMVAALKNQESQQENLKELIRPRNPYRERSPRVNGCAPRGFQSLSTNMAHVDGLIAALQPEMGGIPVLLRQYLSLGGEVLKFNCDPEFSHVIDGFILVDLAGAPLPFLGRIMGKDAAAEFLQVHKPTTLRCA
ncbi:MAG: lysophospholipid acyltransferase family protein [Desulfuromonadales bacterium]